MLTRSVFRGVIGQAVLVVALATPWGMPAAAQSMRDALVSTYNSNPDLMAQRARLRSVDETVSQAVANWRPQVRAVVNYGASQTTSTTRTIGDQDLNPRTYQLQITQPLFRGGRTVAARRTAEADVQAERAVLLDREQIVLLAAVTVYSDLVRDQATVLLRRNNVNVLEQQLVATQARFRVGELTRTDVAQAESRLQQSKSDLIAAEAAAANSRAAYMRVIGQNAGTLAEPPLMGKALGTEDEAIAAAQEKAPRAITAWHRVKSSEFAVDSALGELLPTLNLVGTFQRNFDSNIAGDSLYSSAIQAQLSVPIFQNGAEHSRVRQAKQIVGQRLAELDGARRQSAEAAVRAFRTYEAARARVAAFSAQIAAAQIALEGVRQEAQVGSRTTLDVLNAEQELLNAQVQLTSAKRDVTVGHYSLLSETGQLTARVLVLPVEFFDHDRNYKNVRGAWIGLGD